MHTTPTSLTLRRRTLIASGISLVALVLTLSAAAQAIVLDSFAQLEVREAHNSMLGVVNDLRREQGALARTADELAHGPGSLAALAADPSILR